MEFSVVFFPNHEAGDRQLSELLFDVYVDEGFSEKEWAANAFRAEEVRKRGEIFVVLGKSEILGSVVFNRPGDEFRQIAKADEAEIHLLAVTSSARKNGIATALLHACEQHALALGFKQIVLSTQPRMLAAQALYRRLGYNRNPERDWLKPPGKSYLAFEKNLVI